MRHVEGDVADGLDLADDALAAAEAQHVERSVGARSKLVR